MRSRYTYLSTARAFYDYCRRQDLRADNSARDVPAPKLRRLMPRPMAEDDLRVAVRGANPRMKAWLLLAAFQGLRCKEIAGMRREDLFLDRDPPVMLVSSPKGGHERLLPLNPAVIQALSAH